MSRFVNLVILVLALFATVARAQLTGQALSNCQATKNQLNQQIQALQQQEQQSAAQTAAISAGPPVAYQPGWAAWPFHTWPFASTPTALAAQKHNNYVFQTDNAQIQNLNNQVLALDC